MARDGADRTDRQRVIAAEQDRQPLRAEFCVKRIVQRPVPLDDFGQVAEAIDGRKVRIGRARDVAAIAHIDAELRDRLGDAGHAQGVRSHARPGGTGADVGGRADQADCRLVHGANLCNLLVKSGANGSADWARRERG